MAQQDKRTVLVTGASAGIGLATAHELLADGWTVYAAARRIERMAQLEQHGARLLAMDVTDDASLLAGVQRIAHEAGQLDALVNNAGYGSYGAVEDVPLSEARMQFEVNVFGLARLTQLVLPLMRAQRRGRIVNVSSMGGKIYEPLGAWYHATKFAVEGFSDSLRLELAPHGIDVIVIQPGGIMTEWGSIAVKKLLATSGSTAYAPQAQRHARVLAGSEGAGTGSPPEVIARLISRALRERRPRTRYSAGAGAKELLLLRKWTSDRAFDWILTALFGQLAASGRLPGQPTVP
jgi:NAD(P)-dependent dehydrogenase (short-subunit alcohol dehydrogenase family)